MDTINRISKEAIVEEIDKHERPLTAQEIAETFQEKTGTRVMQQLRQLVESGDMVAFQNGKIKRYAGRSSICAAVADAFPVLIAFYQKTDPRMSELLSYDYEAWKRGKGCSLYRDSNNGVDRKIDALGR